jgi:hypothetical protein
LQPTQMPPGAAAYAEFDKQLLTETGNTLPSAFSTDSHGIANRQDAFALNDVSAQTPQVLCGDLRYGAAIVVEDRCVKGSVASVSGDDVARSCINRDASCEDAATRRHVVFETEKVLSPLAP